MPILPPIPTVLRHESAMRWSGRRVGLSIHFTAQRPLAMKNIRSRQWGYLQVALYVVATILLVSCRAGAFDRATTWVILAACVSAVYGLRHYLRHRYRDYVCEPMRPDELPSDTYDVFNRCMPQFMQLGGGMVGDFRLAYGPHPVFIRYFLPPDSRVKGQICDWDGKFTPSFTTYFSDGRLIESAIMDSTGQKVSDASRLWFFKHEPVSIAELYERHRQAIDAYEASHQASALMVTPSRLAEFAQYGHRLVWWELGKLPKELGEPRLAEMEPILLEAASLTP
jgi:hypothetical protein